MNARVDRPAKLDEPALRMSAITAERFTSREYFQKEWQRMWMRTWHIGGLASQAPEPTTIWSPTSAPNRF